MKGRKPRTPEQKAYIKARREINKMAEKLGDMQNEFDAALDEFDLVQMAVPEDQLAAVEKIFATKEVQVTAEVDNTPVTEPVF